MMIRCFFVVVYTRSLQVGLTAIIIIIIIRILLPP